MRAPKTTCPGCGRPHRDHARCAGRRPIALEHQGAPHGVFGQAGGKLIRVERTSGAGWQANDTRRPMAKQTSTQVRARNAALRSVLERRRPAAPPSTERPSYEQAIARRVTLLESGPGAHGRRVGTETGPKYTRIFYVEKGSGRSAVEFVERSTGNIFKAASWKGPAKGIRGSVYA